MRSRITHKILLLVSLFAATACQQENAADEAVSKPSIYSKNPGSTNLNDLNRVSSVVSVLKNKAPQCSGVAIAKGYVLTAAHCVSSCGTAGAFNCTVFGGSDAYLVKDSSGNDYEVDEVIVPERVNMVNNVVVEGFDLALLRLKWDFKQKTASIATREVADRILEENQDRIESLSQTLIAAGYGAFDDTNKPVWFDGRLRAAYVPFRYYAGIQGNDEILAGSTKVHAAKGDSGGPLLIETNSGTLQVVGIASRMFTLDSVNTFDTDGIYYANVTQPRINQWISGRMRDSGGNMEPGDGGVGSGVPTPGVDALIASFSNLSVTDTRQFAVQQAGNADADILVRGKAIEFIVKGPGGQQIQRVKVNPGSVARINLNFPQQGIHSLEFKCTDCGGISIESLSIYRS